MKGVWIVEKIVYSEIVEFNRCIDKIKGLKNIYRADSKLNYIYLDGEFGLLRNLDAICMFCAKHLRGIHSVDYCIRSIRQNINSITPEHLKNGIINKEEYEREILSICKSIEYLEREVIVSFL